MLEDTRFRDEVGAPRPAPAARRRPRALPALAAILLMSAGAVVGWNARPARTSAALYAQDRFLAVQAHLDEAGPDYVLVAGDSQAELQSPAERVCGAEVVNAGSGGARAWLYADMLPGLKAKRPARAAILAIGTNDIRTALDPRKASALDAFEGHAGRIVAQLQRIADRVVVLALPPIGHERAGETAAKVAAKFDAEAVAPYSSRLERLCARAGCAFADPYSELRDGETGFARPGALRDGLHLAAYRPVARALEAVLCPAGSR